MATTSPDNIYSPDSGDLYALTVDLAAMADSVQLGLATVRGEMAGAASQAQVNAGTGTGFVTPATLHGFIADTDWIDLPYASGFSSASTGQLSYRVRAGVFYLRGGATGSYPSGWYVNVTTAGAIPAQLRPPVAYRAGAFGQGGRAAGVEINPSGAILFANAYSDAPAWIGCLTSYPLD